MSTKHNHALGALVRTLFLATAIAASSVATMSAYAQTANSSQRADAAEELTEVVITGTSIRGVAPTGSEVVTMTRKEILDTSASTTTDLLRKIPTLSGLNASPPIRSDPLDSINLPSIHGLAGSGLVLVLFDGYRAVDSGIIGTSPDPSSIPASALERIEVVPDGASSIYGSDAVTGVVNLVLRRNLEGVEVGGRYGAASPYHRSDANFAVGHTWSGGHFMLAYQYADNSKLLGRDRSRFYGLDQSGRREADGTLGSDYRQTGCDPGTLYVGPNKVSYPLPLGAAGAPNKCDYVGDNSLIPQETRNNVVVSAHQDFNERLSLWGEAFYASHTGEKDTVADPFNGAVLPSTNPYYRVPASYTGAPLLNNDGTGNPIDGGAPLNVPISILDYTSRNLLGTARHDDLSYKTFIARVGLTWKLGTTWEGKFVLNAGHEHDIFDGTTTNNGAIQAALNGTTVDTAINPFGPTSPAVIALLKSPVNQGIDNFETTQKQSEALLSFDGSIFQMSGGDAKLAVGGSYRHETYQGSQTDGTVAAPILLTNVSNSRTVTSEYAEFFLPIIGAANQMAGARRLDVSLSVRHDDYNDFGATTNPKYGVDYSPIEGLKLRANYSTSFHAPYLADDTIPSVDTHAQAFCCIAGLPTIILNGGTAGLKPETAKNLSFGFDENPVSLPGLKFGMTYFKTKFKDQIGYMPPQYLFGPYTHQYYTVNPTPAQVAAFIAGYPINVTSINGQPVGLLLDIRRSNIGQVNFAGMDFNVSYTHRAWGGDMFYSLNGTRLTQYDAKIGQAPFQSALGEGEGLTVHPIKWQGRLQLGWGNEIVDTQLYFNYSDKYLFSSNGQLEPVRAYTPVDFHLGYSPFASGKLKTTQLTLDVDNILNEDPPYVNEGVAGDNAGNGYDKRAANPIGRLVTVGFRTSF